MKSTSTEIRRESLWALGRRAEPEGDERQQLTGVTVVATWNCAEWGRERRRALVVQIRRPDIRTAAVASAIWSGNMC
jgi:hypothetical protein